MQIKFSRATKNNESIAKKAMLRRFEAAIGNFGKFGKMIIFRGARKEFFMEKVYFHTDFIKLAQLMKLANLVGQGSDAKLFIKEGCVKLNGEVCLMRGKKVFDGDVVEFNGKEYIACRCEE